MVSLSQPWQMPPEQLPEAQSPLTSQNSPEAQVLVPQEVPLQLLWPEAQQTLLLPEQLLEAHWASALQSVKLL